MPEPILPHPSDPDSDWFDWVAVDRAITGFRPVGRHLTFAELAAAVRHSKNRGHTWVELAANLEVSHRSLERWIRRYRTRINHTELAPLDPHIAA